MDLNRHKTALRAAPRRQRLSSRLQLAANPDDLKREEEAEDQENKDPNHTMAPLFKIKKLAVPVTALPQQTLPLPSLVDPGARGALNWAIKSTVTFTTRSPLPHLRDWTKTLRQYIPPTVKSYTDSVGSGGFGEIGGTLGYYCFPFPSISQAQRRRISNLIQGGSSGTSSPADLAHFRTLLDSWRPAFMALYDHLRATPGAHFYYHQHDHSALFRHAPHDGRLEAVLCRCGEGMRAVLEREGIRYETLGKDDIVHEQDQDDHNMMEMENDDGKIENTDDNQNDENIDDEDGSNSESSGSDPETIRAEINNRMKRRRTTVLHRRSQRHTTLRISHPDVHLLYDHLLNQRDGRSFVILPELVSPTPFLLGTACRAEVAVHGPDGEGCWRVRVSGTVLPTTVAAIHRALQSTANGRLEVVAETDHRTSTLSALSFPH